MASCEGISGCMDSNLTTKWNSTSKLLGCKVSSNSGNDQMCSTLGYHTMQVLTDHNRPKLAVLLFKAISVATKTQVESRKALFHQAHVV